MLEASVPGAKRILAYEQQEASIQPARAHAATITDRNLNNFEDDLQHSLGTLSSRGESNKPDASTNTAVVQCNGELMAGINGPSER